MLHLEVSKLKIVKDCIVVESSVFKNITSYGLPVGQISLSKLPNLMRCLKFFLRKCQ